MTCKDCTKRVLYCHSTCQKYLAFQKKQAEIKAKQREELVIHSYVIATAKKNRDKREKKQNLPNKNYRN